MRKYFYAAAAAMFMLGSCSQGGNQANKSEQACCEQSAKQQTALEFAKAMGLGWNLGNNLDAHENGVSNETCWHDQPATQAVFDTIAKVGFTTVRIPTTWMGHIGEAPEFKIDDAWMNRVAEVVEMAHKSGLKVILNVHHDGFGDQKKEELKPNHWLNVVKASQDTAFNAQVVAKLSAVWSQIASKFKDASAEWLVFETLNEIQDGNWGNGSNTTDGGKQYATLNQWNQVAVDAIRAAGGQNAERYIGIPGYVTSPHLTIEHLVVPTDKAKDKIMVAVHSYDPWEFAGSGKFTEWGHTGKDIAPETSEDTYTGMLDQLVDKFVKNGIPVYFGEFGAIHRKDSHAEEFRKYYLEYVVKAMSDRNISCIYWDNGYLFEGDEAFGLLNHQTGAFLDNGKEVCEIMVKAYQNSDTAYTLKSIYDRAPQAK